MEVMSADRIMFPVDYPFESMNEAAGWRHYCGSLGATEPGRGSASPLTAPGTDRHDWSKDQCFKPLEG
jgi:hypothetical protein